MDEKDKALILEFKKDLPSVLKTHVKQIIVFGSRARGGATEKSDLDVIVLVDEKTLEIEKKLEDIVYQIMWTHNFKPIISLKVLSESRFYEAIQKGFSFYRQVEKDAVVV